MKRHSLSQLRANGGGLRLMLIGVRGRDILAVAVEHRAQIGVERIVAHARHQRFQPPHHP